MRTDGSGERLLTEKSLEAPLGLQMVGLIFIEKQKLIVRRGFQLNYGLLI